MADGAQTLGFGVTYDMVAARTACGQSLSLTSHRGCGEIPPHKHSNDYLCVVLRGGFAEQEGGRSHERLSGCFFTHHAGETHFDRVGPRGAVCVNLHFATGVSATTGDGMCCAKTRVVTQGLALELAAGVREELAIASLAAELLGRLHRPTCSTDNGRWIDTLVEAISDEPERRWTLRELARIADRHPVHVAQAFRAKTSVSLGAFQRLQRLMAVSLVLRYGASPLAEIAADFGYCDQSHMTSEFRASFGITPGRYRRAFH